MQRNTLQELYRDERFTIECNEGYQLVGNKNFLACHAGSKYSDILPTCEKIDPNAGECEPRYIQNAYYQGSRLSGHSIQVYIKNVLYKD